MKESEAKRGLRSAGCVFIRYARGRHEIWQEPNGSRFTFTVKKKGRSVDRNMRHKILKMARAS